MSNQFLDRDGAGVKKGSNDAGTTRGKRSERGPTDRHRVLGHS